MKRNLFFIIILFISNYLFAQCPEPIGAMINACGSQEGINELVLFNSGGTDGPASSFRVKYGTGTPPSTNVMPGSCATSPTGGASITGCTIINVTSPSTNIPANSTVVFIPSNFNNSYNLSAICGGGTIYVVYIDITNTGGCNTSGIPNWVAAGTMANTPSSPRYLQVTGPDANCGTSGSPVLSYSNGWSSNTDGNYVSWDNGTPSYSNSGCNAPLSSDIVEFDAKNIGKTNQLTWVTASEKDNVKFEIERSEDGYQFEKIGEVAGRLNSSTIQSYSFIDENPIFGLNYYRLKNVDIIGRADYSIIKSANQISRNVIVKPTMVSTNVEIDIYGMESPIMNILNLDGKIVIPNIDCNSGKNRINVDNLSSGIYFIHIKSIDNQSIIEKFVKI